MSRTQRSASRRARSASLARLLLAMAAVLIGWERADARGVIFASGMEAPSIEPLYPEVAGQPQLPPGPASDALAWFLGQLEPGASPSDQEIQANFSQAWLASIDVAQTRSFLASVRDGYPDAVVSDLVAIGPMAFTGLIQGSNGNEAFVSLGTGFADPRINLLGVNGFGTGSGTVILPNDRSLGLSQAADRFSALAGDTGLFVGRVDHDGQCQPVEVRNPSTLRATASIFKIWVLGGVAADVANGALAVDQGVIRVDALRAPGGPVVNEPDGTVFSLDEAARLMMGVSDNTATDLLHDLVGRDRLNAIVSAFGHAQPGALTPLLGISETFHLLFSFPLIDAQDYVAASEPAQAQFVVDELEPLGSIADNGGGFNNVSLFTTGTWLASPTDVCQALAAHREWPNGSDAAWLADRALGAQAAQPRVRGQWDRVWYKGGNLVGDVGADGQFEQLVLTHAWLLEDEGEQPWVVVAMANDTSNDIDSFEVQSITGRILELVRQAD